MQQSAQSSEARKIRGVSLLSNEDSVSMLTREEGIVEDIPEDGSLLVLANKRLLSFSVENNREETVITTLENVHAAETTIAYRNNRPLIQGLGLIILGIVAYFVVGLFIVKNGVFVPSVVGIVIGLFGLYQILRYFFWEEEAAVTFQAWGNGQSEGHWRLAFECYGESARQSQRLVDAFFNIKMDEHPDEPEPASSSSSDTADSYSASRALAVEPPPVPPFLAGLERDTQIGESAYTQPSEPSPGDDASETIEGHGEEERDRLADPGAGGDIQT